MKLLFGTGGSPHSSRSASTIDGIRRIADLGLGCVEMEFVYGVRMSEAQAGEVKKVAHSLGVALTVHAPYYINLNAIEPEKIEASQKRLWQTAHIGALCGANSVAFHAAFYLDTAPQEVYGTVRKYLGEVVDKLKEENNNIWLRPEIMGRGTQFGTLDEVFRLSTELPRVLPCIDFAHWHARNGGFNSYPEFIAVLEQVKHELGPPPLANMHIHVSGIAYGKKGEIKHLDFAEADFNYRDFVRALKETGVGGYVICESPNLEKDARLLKEAYEAL